MKVKSESEVAQSFPTLSNLMDCSPPGSPVHGIFQARKLEWGTIALETFKMFLPFGSVISFSFSFFFFLAYMLCWVLVVARGTLDLCWGIRDLYSQHAENFLVFIVHV